MGIAGDNIPKASHIIERVEIFDCRQRWMDQVSITPM
ncbi:hypothetical protein RD1_1903 [Roseobacter denitrificans OCh 114]|uniref:Uncharacterized protein n=1 Tax=Roseobacter denitrificans (strain ATCC 33942 / OCh 114) TaxID=375451 RepID=Q168T0_ROSDO|nr:hypothetical protein RD1_1903 [Roseobacter denitrificans OCh 114]